MTFNRIGVLGCGLMGSGIAEVCARAGIDVVVVEATAEAVKAGRDRVSGSLSRAVARGTEVCGYLSEFARPVVPTREVTTVERVLEKALAATARDRRNAGIHTVLDYAAQGTPVHVAVEQLCRGFCSIIDNACRAMDVGGTLTLHSRTETGERGRTEAVIEISDTGRGIEPEHVGQVFTPFFTAASAPVEIDSRRIGLGLTVTRSAVAGHGGTISVRSEVGEGTTVTVRLPAAAAEQTQADRTDAAVCIPATPPEVAGTRDVAPADVDVPGAEAGLRVLLVEDEEDLRDTLSESLCGCGYDVTSAGDGESGASALAAAEFDIVVTDLMMPRGGGEAVLRAAGEVSRRPATLLITGRQEAGLEQQMASLGVDACLRKPFGQADLLAAVRRLASSSSGAAGT